MSNKNIINSLESIQKKTIYSKYGENLNRIFKSRSLKSLIYELKNQKKFSYNEYFETEQYNNKKKTKEINEDNYLDIFNSMQQYLKKENKKEIHKEQKESPFNKIRIKNERDIIDKNGFKDPFKYNPNYNAISKNVPSVKMILTEKEKKEMKKNNLKLIHSKTESGDKKNQILLDIVDPNSKVRNNSPKSRNVELPLITKVPNQKERSITVENVDF